MDTNGHEPEKTLRELLRVETVGSQFALISEIRVKLLPRSCLFVFTI